jgi:hypothetical protein
MHFDQASISRAQIETFEKFQKRLLRPPAELARLATRSIRWVSGQSSQTCSEFTEVHCQSIA